MLRVIRLAVSGCSRPFPGVNMAVVFLNGLFRVSLSFLHETRCGNYSLVASG